MFVAKLVKRCGVAALLYEYRLAPEHPYPAALEDTVTTYQWLLEQGYRPDRTLFVGESAGAGLELAALLALRDRGIPLPSAVVSMSPVTDLTLSGESHRINARSCLSPPGMAEVCAKAYAGEQDPVLPYISPLFGDLQGLPPLFITAGGSEILRDDAIRFADKASKSGVETRLLVGEGMMHCYPLMAPFFPEATRAMDEITQFIHQHLPSM
jgi:acetyl esterase/lipase